MRKEQGKKETCNSRSFVSVVSYGLSFSRETRKRERMLRGCEGRVRKVQIEADQAGPVKYKGKRRYKNIGDR